MSLTDRIRNDETGSAAIVAVLLAMVLMGAITGQIVTARRFASWHVGQPLAAELTGLDHLARRLAFEAGDTDPGLHLARAADLMVADGRSDGGHFEVNGDYGLVTLERGGSCRMLVAAFDLTPGTVSRCSDTFSDAEPPQVALAAPGPDAPVWGTVTVVADVLERDPAVNVTVTVAGIGQLAASRVGHTRQHAATFDTSGLPDGLTTVTVTATDTAGHQTSQTSQVTVANDQPAVVATGPDAAVARTATLQLETSPTVVAAAVTGPAGTSAVPLAADGTASHLFDVTAVADGQVELEVTAADRHGRTATAVVTVTVDNTAPQVAATAPSGTQPATFELPVTASDTGAGVATRTVTAVPTAGDPVVVETGPDGPVVVGPLASGDYTLRATATDTAGNARTVAAGTVTVDGDAPAFTFTAPTDGHLHAGGTLSLTGVSDDATATATYRLAGGTDTAAAVATDGTVTADIDTSGVADGDHLLEVTLTDVAGNGSTASVTVTIDTSAPQATFSADTPADGAQVSGTVTVGADVTDLSAVEVAFAITNAGSVPTDAQWVDDPTDPYAVTWDADAAGPGSYDLHLRVTDAAGHTTTGMRTVTVP